MVLRISAGKITAYLTVFITVYMSGSVIFSVNAYDGLRGFLHILLLGLLCFASISGGIGKRLATAFIISFIYYTACVIHYSATWIALLLRIVWFIGYFGFIRYCTKRQIDLVIILYKIITAICIWSFVFYILINILQVRISYTLIGNPLNGVVYRNYFGIYYFRDLVVQKIGEFKFYEYTSIFWEHGILGIYLIFGLYYLLFVAKTKNKIGWVVFYCMNILLTFSTTAIGLMAMLLSMYMIFEAKITRPGRKIIAVPMLLSAVFVAYMALNHKKNTSGSYMLRVNDLVNGFLAFLKNPVSGSGFQNFSEFYRIQGYDTRGSSNGLMAFLMTMGLCGLFVVAVPVVKNIVYLKKKDKEIHCYLIFIITTVAVNMSEPILEMPVMMLFIASEYNQLILNIAKAADRTKQKKFLCRKC